MKRTLLKKTNKRLLAYSVAAALSIGSTAYAADYPVTNPEDDGTGQQSGTLSWAILQANTDGTGAIIVPPAINIADTITLQTDVTITGVMKSLINSDITLQSDSTPRTIYGGDPTDPAADRFRPLFVKSGNVTIKNLNLTNGQAKGGDSDTRGPFGRGGAGAGLGGALFVYGGNVLVEDVNFRNNEAIGGSANGPATDGGSGNGVASGGGGLFGSSYGSTGGGMFVSYGPGIYGGNGNYSGSSDYGNSIADFGQGAGYADSGFFHTNGGFGGGGYGGSGGAGGFGGGGGGGVTDVENGGAGGFGGGGGSGSGTPGEGGFGGGRGGTSAVGGGGGGGMGGAIFVMNGITTLNNVTFSENSVVAGTGGVGAEDGSALASDVFIYCHNEDVTDTASCAASVNFCGTNEETNIAGNNIVGTLGTDCPFDNEAPTAVKLDYPTAVDDYVSVIGSDTVTIDALANDLGSGLTLDAEEISLWSFKGGNVAVVDNKITYKPKTGFNDGDKIWYVFEDALERPNYGTITISVSDNDGELYIRPIGTPDTVNITPNQTITIDVLDNDQGNGLSLILGEDNLSNPYWSMGGGKVEIVDNKILYTPKLDSTEDDIFWYDFEDSEGIRNYSEVNITIIDLGEDELDIELD